MSAQSKRKVAVITGGGSGIGLAIARAFAAAGYAVVISGRDQKRLQSTVKQFQARTVDSLPCDITDPAAVEKLFATIRRQHPAVDVLVNNAGIAHALAPVSKLDPRVWKHVIETNLTGTFLVTRAALPLLRAGGAIVNNISIAAVEVFKGMSAYNASKAGALSFTRVLREELREQGIRVLALMPGATDTDIWKQFWPDAPHDKMISADTVAQAVLHAVSAPANTAIEEIRIGPVAGVL